MKLITRPYQSEEDYWRIREFLRQVIVLNHCRELSWHVARLDYWWWFANPHLENINLAENVFFWETASGQIAAVLNPEGRGQAFPQVHPDFHTPQLADEIVSVAQDRLAAPGKDGQSKIWFYIDSHDQVFQETLVNHGFKRVEKPEVAEVQHRRLLDHTLPEPTVIAGYAIRPLGDGLELLERCYASGLGFHEDDIHVARDNRDHPEWYRHIQSAPLYCRDLDLVAVAADGSIVSFCTFWFDDVSRTAYGEPVATVPAHQRRGLSRAVMLHGLHRLRRMGCKVAFVGGYSQAANALYFSVMGPEHDISEPWEKLF